LVSSKLAQILTLKLQSARSILDTFRGYWVAKLEFCFKLSTMLSTTPTWDRPQPKRKQGEPDPQVPEPPNKQQHVQQPGCMAINLARGTLPTLAVLFTLYSAVDISRRCSAPSDVAARVQINKISARSPSHHRPSTAARRCTAVSSGKRASG